MKRLQILTRITVVIAVMTAGLTTFAPGVNASHTCAITRYVSAWGADKSTEGEYRHPFKTTPYAKKRAMREISSGWACIITLAQYGNGTIYVQSRTSVNVNANVTWGSG